MNAPKTTVNRAPAQAPAETARATLAMLIQRFGHGLSEDPRRCQALLRDFCGKCRREINILIAAIEERVPAELLETASNVPVLARRLRLARQLQDRQGLAEQAAHWAVDTWAVALGVISASEACVPVDSRVPANGPTAPVGPHAAASHISAPATPPPVPARCPGCQAIVQERLPYCRQCGAGQLIACPRCEQESHLVEGACTLCGMPLADALRYEQLRKAGLELLRSAQHSDILPERWERACQAATTLSEAHILLPQAAETAEAHRVASQLAVEAGLRFRQQLCRDHDYSTAAEVLRQLLSIEPHQADAARLLQELTASRERFLEKARRQIADGRPHAAVSVLQSALELFSKDDELQRLLAECRRQVEDVQHLARETIPELVRGNLYCQLREILDDLQSRGLQIQWLESHRERVAVRLDWAAQLSTEAAGLLEVHDYPAALRKCEEVLALVADHAPSRRLHALGEQRQAEVDQQIRAVEQLIAAGRCFSAALRLRDIERHPVVELRIEHLEARIRDGVRRANAYLRLLLFTVVGLILWLLSGWLASVVRSGLAEALTTRSMEGGILTTDTISDCVAALALFTTSAVTLTLLGVAAGQVRILRSAFALILTSSFVGLLYGAVETVSDGLLPFPHPSRDASQFGAFIEQAVSFCQPWFPPLAPSAKGLALGAATTLLLATVAAGVLNARGLRLVLSMPLAAAAGGITALATEALPSGVDELLLVISYCVLASVTGLVTKWHHFVLVPLAGLFSFGLSFGIARLEVASPDLWMIPANVLLLGSALVMFVLPHGDWRRAVGVYALAAALSAAVPLLAYLPAHPSAWVLAAVWLSAWGSIAALLRRQIDFRFHFSDRAQLRKASRQASVPSTVSK